jgi:hypothetical protein
MKLIFITYDALLPKLLSRELRLPSPRLRPTGVPTAAEC